jgi:para-nitrobenzyl esterase
MMRLMADLVVETTCGKVRGELRDGVASWKGIPYAAPPLGALRFRPPQPAVPWAGERDATRFGPVAAQSRDPAIAMLSGVTAKVVSSEDCLVLNVFAPAGDEAQALRPVMVWIHGGAFVMGSGSTPLYHGAPFAQQGLVVVTINYRLGLPGFLFLGDLAPDRPSGNCALLDQVAALRWVRDNIAAFGGDPSQVTVMGESAGAISIATLLAMPAARGLLHRAILQSGASGLSPPTRQDATKIAQGVLAELSLPVDQLDRLADVPLEQLLACQERLVRERGLGAFAPYVDGVSVPRDPIDAIREGAAAGIPLLAGSNRDEWALFAMFLGDAVVAPFKPLLRGRLGGALDPLLALHREAHADRSEARAWIDVIGDVVFRIPVIRLAEAQAAHAPVYLYRFDRASTAFGGRLGAAHATELPFVWNRLDLPMSRLLLGEDVAASQPLATAMHARWTQFLRTGDPNPAGSSLPQWPRYDAARRATLLLDDESKIVDDPGGDTRELWSAL